MPLDQKEFELLNDDIDEHESYLNRLHKKLEHAEVMLGTIDGDNGVKMFPKISVGMNNLIVALIFPSICLLLTMFFRPVFEPIFLLILFGMTLCIFAIISKQRDDATHEFLKRLETVNSLKREIEVHKALIRALRRVQALPERLARHDRYEKFWKKFDDDLSE